MRYRTIGSGDNAFEASALCLGTMLYGWRTDEETSFAILDRYVERGGTFLDTANNYGDWEWPEGGWKGAGRISEAVLGRWLTARGPRARDQVRIATKLGAARKDSTRPLSYSNFEGLSQQVVATSARESLRLLGIDRIDLLYGHVDDRETPLAETVGAFGKLQAEGLVGVTGISNVSLWRVVEAREEAARQGIDPYAVVQQNFTYAYPTPKAERFNWASPELLSYAASTGVPGRPALTVVGYSPLLQGAYTRSDKPLFGGYDHPTTHARVQALHDVGRELGATPNQVVIAWILAQDVVPLVGASTVAQLDEALDAVDLDLGEEVLARLDAV
ncbi:aldo/keto reductase [Xylanimonas cellulosilytica DSM 15894]|uniref:Aldo/keto reductase n=1 Tax=Xylanimonas cellulosilytica (strain DSM 15894 / JCM 12276 / CECT 5975 / KCTC 9989 / LMG 20990 / NBRC 107835 / XIL07) TaxID=446471 RepID=D1BZC2_XYLCX|nr:aldo/keto reductase [Xylanimonas cellulosilytica]ACZ32019.1 aldo/keto reductase [Xylanimonas cellulosilytica DSM 15894]